MTREPSWTKPAIKDLRRLDVITEKRIHRAVERLASAGHGDVKRLVGRDSEWRLRVGDWRVTFTLDSGTGGMLVLRVRHRSSVYDD